MAVVSMKQLLEAGVHFGHQTRRWNPKMASMKVNLEAVYTNEFAKKASAKYFG